MPDCLALSPENIADIPWLPATCAYRLIFEGKELEWWHPLISRDAETVKKAGISPHGKIISEECIHDEQLSEHIIDWIKF